MESYKETQALYEQNKTVVTRVGILGATAFETPDGNVKAELVYGSTFQGVVNKFWRVTNAGIEVMYVPDGVNGLAQVFDYFIDYLKNPIWRETRHSMVC